MEKQEKIAHLRQLLWEASHREHIDTEELKKCAFDLREELPDDFRAVFYEAACSKNAKDTIKFLKRYKASEHDDDDNEEIVAFLIKSLKPLWISHVANLIESAFNHEGKLPLYTQWINKFEAEAAKINEGIYDVTLPRDVFIAYSSADKDVVFEVADYLEEQGISCFVALRNLQHGVGAVQNYEASLKKAIDACEIFVLISSAHSRSNQCDAFTKEMAYLRDKEMHEAPPQYHRNSYDSLPDKYKKKRVEFVIDEYRNTPFDSVTKQFFAGLTWCRSIEELATRVLLLRDSAAIDDDPVKYCRQCGAECQSDAEKCKKCGSKTFFATKEAYEEYKKQEEELRRQKEELERQKALQEAEMLRRQLEIEREKAKAGSKGGAKDTTPTLKRAYLFAENGDFANASTYAEKVLDMDPECAEAYIIKLMVELKCKKPEFLRDAQNEFNKNQNYQMAIRFASPELKARLEQANQAIVERKEEERKAAIYATATKLLSQKKYQDAITEFKRILAYRDAKDKIKACEDGIEEKRKADIYSKASKLFTQKKFDDAADEFRKLGDWKDAQAQVLKCAEAKENARKEEIYQDAIDDIKSAEQSVSYKELTLSYVGKLDRAIKRLEQAIKKLQTVVGYKDSQKRITELQARISGYRKEQEDIKAVVARRAARRKRRRRNLLLFVIINTILACLAIFVALPYVNYQQGNKLLEAGDYQAAYEKYSQPTIFGGAKKQAEILSNVFSIAEGKNLNDSIAALLQLGVPVKMSLQLEGGEIPDSQTAKTPFGTVMPLSEIVDETPAPEVAPEVVYSYATSSDFSGIPLPEKTGNTLVKWTVSSCTYTLDAGLDVHFSAVWAMNEYTILFQDAKKYPDTLYVTFNYNYEGSTDTVVALKNNDILAYPEIPTREGYLFGGWYEEATCETLHEFSGELTADKVLYAKWLSLDYTYKSTISVGNGDITHVDNDVHYYPFVPLVDQTITIYTTGNRDTYGYLCDANRQTLDTDDDNGADDNFYIRYNVYAGQLYYIGVKFYGSYDLYEATLYVDGISLPTSAETASCADTAYVEYQEGESYTEKVVYGQDIEYPVLYKYGYTFVGWYDGNQKVESGVCSFLDNVVLTARFTPQVNTITLNANGGQVSDTTVYVTYLEDYTLPAPTKTGHTFGGWAVQEDGSSFASTGNWELLKDYTLIAKWTANSYDVVLDDVKQNNASVTVTFNYNYTGAPTAATVKVSNGQTLDRPANPTRTGYVFTGWYTNSSCTTKYEFNGTIKGDITLYAGWGEMTMGNAYSEIQLYPSEYASSSDYYSISTDNNTNSSAVRHIYLVAEESGTHYIYWKNKNASSSYKFYLQIKNLTTNSTIRSNSYSGTYSTSFNNYASFSCNKGDIIVISFYRYSTSYASTAYFYFSGFGAPSASTAKVSSVYQYDYDVSATTTKQLTYDSDFTLPVPVRPGYTFGGWFEGEGGTGTQLTGANGQSSSHWQKTEPTTLYAKWIPSTYTITFNRQYGIGGDSSVTATYTSAMPTAIAPTRSGFIFLGYFDEATGGTKYYNADMTSAKTWDKTTDTTLYAQWQGISYSIAYNANGGTGAMPSQSMSFGVVAAIKSNGFVRTGYTFSGWNTQENGTGTSYAEGETVNNLTTTKDAVITLYAQWTANTHTVTLNNGRETCTVSFDLNGASGTAPSPQVVSGTTGLTYPTPPTDTGYAFAGWYTTSSCTGQPYDFSAPITGDITLYAKWVTMVSASNCSTRGYFNSASYYSASHKYTFSVTGSTSTSANYYYFTAYKSGSYTIYGEYKTGDFYYYVHNVTRNTTAVSSTNLHSGNASKSATFTANAGDVFYVRVYKYSSTSSNGSGTLYITGAGYPTAGGKASVETEQVTFGSDTFVFSVPTQTGYTFAGWYDGANGTGTQYTDAYGVSVRAWDKDADTTLHPKWTPNIYTVTLNKQGGTGGVPSVKASFGKPLMVQPVIPQKTGYTFLGYFTAASGGTKYYNADMTSAKNWDLASDTTLYAQWQINTYTVYLRIDVGTLHKQASVTYNSAWPTFTSSDAPSKAGYKFLGFFDAMTGGTQYYSASMQKVGPATQNWTSTTGATLYAQWQATSTSVTFNSNGGEGTQAGVTATYGQEMPDLTGGTIPTKEGYIFAGYYDAAEGGTKYYNADLSSAKRWDRTITTTLYAQWQGVPYVIAFDANGGTGTMSNQSMVYGVGATLKSNTFTRPGYTFDGWSTKANGTGTYYGSTAVVSNLTSTKNGTVTLYAQWIPNSYSVTLDDIKAPGVTVTFNYNYTGSPISTIVKLVNGNTLARPTNPVRSGYVFTGWYTSSDCTTRYDFTGSIVSNVTLYAGWKQKNMSSAYQHTEIVPYNYPSSNLLKVSTTNTSSSNKIHLYFVAEKAGTHTISWSNSTSGSSYAYYFSIYSLTDNTTVKGSTLVSGTGFGTISIPCEAGEVLVISLYRYSTSYHSVAYFYFGGFSAPAVSTAKISCEANHIYDASQTVSQNITYDTNFTFPAPVREGYTFAGWYDGVGGTGTQYTDATGKSVKAWDKAGFTTLYAKWTPINCTVTFDKQGGTDGSTSATATYGASMPTATPPTKVGYTFMGYYSAMNGGGTQYYTASMASAKKWDKTTNLTLFAYWQANTYTITLSLRGGTGSGSATVQYNAEWPTPNQPTRTGYIFKGFFDAITGGTQYYTATMDKVGPATSIWTGTKGITLYAQWDAISSTISFNANGGEGTQTSVTTSYDTLMPSITVAPTREGYIFQGYFDAQTGGNKYYNADLTPARTAWNKVADTTLYAQWQGVPYVIAYNANGGTGTMSNQSMAYGTSSTIRSCAYTRPGYTFTGWNTKEDGSGISYTAGEIIYNLTTIKDTVINLYAQWQVNTYTVTLDEANGTKKIIFNLNGGTGTPPETQIVSDKKGLTYPTPPTREGYVFVGWYTNSSGAGEPFDFSAPVYQSLNLYAKWEPMSAAGVNGVFVDAPVFNTSSLKAIMTVSGTSSSPNYYYFTTYTTGSYTIYLNYMSGDFYINVYNVTQGVDLVSNRNWYNTNSTVYKTFSANAGDVLFVRVYRYSSSTANGAASFYVSGASYPTAGGKVPTATQEITYDSNDFSFPVLSKAGYTFGGWYDGIGGTGTQYADETGASVKSWDKASNTTLYAKWIPKTYVVTFNKVFGTGGSDTATVTYGSPMPKGTAPTRAGYTFAGYYTATTDGVRYYYGDMSSAKVWDMTASVTLYARWIPNTYAIDLNFGGGSGIVTMVTATYNDVWPSIPAAPTRYGYNFKGFFDAPTGGTMYYTASLSKLGEATSVWTKTEGMKLYAQWTPKTTTISFDANGGIGTLATVTATYTEALPTITTAPTKEGYVFAGYFDAITGGTKYYNADLSAAKENWDIGTNTTLYAQWQGIPYTIVFRPNGADSGSMSGQELEYGTSASLKPNAYTRTGYTFTGWNTQADGNGTSYAAGQTVSNLTMEADSVIILYAQWDAQTYTVTLNEGGGSASYTVSFNLNGASGTAPAAQTVTATQGLTYPTPPMRSGYAFAGWYTNSSGTGTHFDFSQEVTGNTILYAKWKQMKTEDANSNAYYNITNYSSSSRAYFSSVTSNTKYNYYYFTAYKTGTYTMYVEHAAGDYWYQVYNETQSTTVLNVNLYSSKKTASASFQANAGDVFYVKVYKYSESSATGSGYFYLSGASYPVAGGKSAGYASLKKQITYGETFNVSFTTPVKAGYTFLGWYDEDGTKYIDANGDSVKAWDIAQNTTLYARWSKN